MEQTNLPTAQPKSWPTFSLVSTSQVQQAVKVFGPEYSEFVLCAYHKPKGISKAVASRAPTFYDVSNYFTEEATRFWLRLHIAETFAFLGIYDTASKYQVQQTADLIMQHEIYGQLTLDEFHCFLQRFKTGSYGKIYQSSRPNPQEFLACLKPFWNELSYERGRQAEKEKQERLSSDLHSPENITYEEWLKEKESRGEVPIHDGNPLNDIPK